MNYTGNSQHIIQLVHIIKSKLNTYKISNRISRVFFLLIRWKLKGSFQLRADGLHLRDFANTSKSSATQNLSPVWNHDPLRGPGEKLSGLCLWVSALVKLLDRCLTTLAEVTIRVCYNVAPLCRSRGRTVLPAKAIFTIWLWINA